jgi:hypothetical protein
MHTEIEVLVSGVLLKKRYFWGTGLHLGPLGKSGKDNIFHRTETDSMPLWEQLAILFRTSKKSNRRTRVERVPYISQPHGQMWDPADTLSRRSPLHSDSFSA